MKKCIFLIFSLCAGFAHAQVGGNNSFEFLSFPLNARIAGQGGENISLRNEDVNLAFQNPASINEKMQGRATISYVPYLAKINGTFLAGAFPVRNNTFAVGLTFFNYGEMEETASNGDVIGSFSPTEYAVTAATSQKQGNFSLGASLKLASSQISSYSAHAITTDIGGMFIHPEREWTIGLAVKNLGFAFKKYTDAPMSVPLDVQIGTTYKPEHMPLRFSLTAHHLHKLDIVYLDPSKKGKKDLEGNEIKEKKTLADQIGRHFVFGGEFIFSKNFNLLFGYNILRRRELRTEAGSGGAGFSLGFAVTVKKFDFTYSHAFYSVAGGTNHLTLSADLTGFRKKKQKKEEGL